MVKNIISNGNYSTVCFKKLVEILLFQDILFILKLLICKRNIFEQKKGSAFIAQNFAHRFTSFATAQLLQLSKSVAKKLLSVFKAERETSAQKSKSPCQNVGKFPNFLKKSKNQFPVLV